MKRNFLSVFALIFILILTSVTVQASVLIEVNNVRDKHVNAINFTGASTVTRVADKVTVPIVDSTMIAAGAANGGATSATTTAAAIPVTAAYVNMIISSDSGFVTKTLADGKIGQILTLHIYLDESSETLTVTPATSTGWSVASFDSLDDQLTLLFVETDGWIVLSNTSVTLTP